MKDFSLLVSQLRRPTDLPEERQTRDTATIEARPPAPAAVEEPGSEVRVLRLLQVVALLALPLSLYLVYTQGEYYGYRGLLAAVILVNLLVLARIDAAHHRQIQQQLQSFRSNNPNNHE